MKLRWDDLKLFVAVHEQGSLSACACPKAGATHIEPAHCRARGGDWRDAV